MSTYVESLCIFLCMYINMYIYICTDNIATYIYIPDKTTLRVIRRLGQPGDHVRALRYALCGTPFEAFRSVLDDGR